jgi:hypothetical protein
MLPIRSAERRRWTADLLRDDSTCLVLYGAAGIGKSTLARQIEQRIHRLRPDERLTVLDDFEPGTRDIDAIPGKLLITCRAPFPSKRRGVIFRRVGPLTRSGAGELASSLENLRGLAPAEIDSVWRLVAGHPQTMKDLDARLPDTDFAGLSAQLSAAVTAITGWAADRLEPTELPPDVAETIAVVAAGFLAKYRVPVLGGSAARRRSKPRRCAKRNAALASATVLALAALAAAGLQASAPVRQHSGARPATALANGPARAAAGDEARAAAWLVGQLAPGTEVACAPAACPAVPRTMVGHHAAILVTTGPAADGAAGSAPILARFGSIEIRLAAKQALAEDRRERLRAGNELLANPRLRLAPGARGELAAGEVDARLLITLAALLERQPVTVTAFGDGGPGADPGIPLRSATIEGASGVAAFFASQPSPFRPRGLVTTGNEIVVRFDVATSFGLLEG